MTVVKIKAKKLFFDRKYVEGIVGKQSAKALGKAGAFVRQRARSLLRRRKRVSSPGQSPSVHSNDETATLKNIWFALDEQSKTVVIGPLALNQVNTTRGGDRVTVPELMEFGGDVQIHEQQLKLRLGKHVTPSQIRAAMEQPWRRTDLRRNRKPWFRYRVRQAHYAARPFMWPALFSEAQKFPQLWFREMGKGFTRGAAA